MWRFLFDFFKRGTAPSPTGPIKNIQSFRKGVACVVNKLSAHWYTIGVKEEIAACTSTHTTEKPVVGFVNHSWSVARVIWGTNIADEKKEGPVRYNEVSSFSADVLRGEKLFSTVTVEFLPHRESRELSVPAGTSLLSPPRQPEGYQLEGSTLFWSVAPRVVFTLAGWSSCR